MRLYNLQIVKGEEYLNNFNIRIKKEQDISNTRGKIFDCKGRVIAYNDLVYSLVIEDSGEYDSLEDKNKALNNELLELFNIIESNGDKIRSDFDITIDNNQYVYMSSGNSLLRFLADIYGRTYTYDLTDEERSMSAIELMNYLCSEKVYDIDQLNLPKATVLKLVTIRTDLSFNNYQKYIKTVISENINALTKSEVLENIEKYTGISIDESIIRRYNYSPYMSHIIGYVGSISDDELSDYKNIDEKYDESYIVGKTGIEKSMESNLQGTNGYNSFYVNNLGRVIETDEKIDPVSGNDVFLSIDADYQETIYKLLEEHLAGILRSKLVRTSAYQTRKIDEADDLVVSIDEVYVQLINNSIIDIDRLYSDKASDNEREAYNIWKNKYDLVINSIGTELNNNSSKPIIDYDEEYQKYQYQIINFIADKEILKKEAVQNSYTPFKKFEEGSISLREFLTDCIVDELIDITKLINSSSYADADELYKLLTDYIETYIINDNVFEKLIYEYLILDKQLSGRILCLIMYDQGVFPMNTYLYNGLSSGTVSPFDFIYDRISSLELTPAQIALDPCSASVVLTDVNNGKVLAMVSYPGYDNNKLTNRIDTNYYNDLINDESLPLYNRATQQKTAPGSTFKMISAIAGLEENVIDINQNIEVSGVFTRMNSDNKCWIYPLNHGRLNVTEAIRHSCNCFFYEVGYRLGLTGSEESSFNDSYGISKLNKYTEQFGLTEVSGVEISESEPHIATQYPVTAAIGQSDNNYTVSQLSRYVSTIANGGNLYKLSLLNNVNDSEGNIITSFEPKLIRKLNFSNQSWNAVKNGMRLMAESSSVLSSMNIEVSGKTGTAQEVSNRADHALFIGYAPSSAPQVSIAVRIPYGYVSSNAVEIARDVLNYYFNITPKEEMINGQAITPGTEVIHD